MIHFRQVELTLVILAAVLLCAAVSPPRSAAYSQDYCGVLITSHDGPPWSCTSAFASIYYNSARYTGSGNIQRLTANLSGGSAGAESTAFNATFTSICRRILYTQYGRVAQYDGTARHTIYGHVDNSPNHTGCVNF